MRWPTFRVGRMRVGWSRWMSRLSSEIVTCGQSSHWEARVGMPRRQQWSWHRLHKKTSMLDHIRAQPSKAPGSCPIPKPIRYTIYYMICMRYELMREGFWFTFGCIDLNLFGLVRYVMVGIMYYVLYATREIAINLLIHVQGKKNITVFWGKWDKSNCTHLQKKYTKATVGGIIDALTSMVPRVKVGVHFNQVYIRFLSALYSHSRARLCQGQQREVTQQLPQHHTFVLLSIALLAGLSKTEGNWGNFRTRQKSRSATVLFFFFLFLFFFTVLFSVITF